MIRLASALALCCSLVPAALTAQDAPVVVELFTSQGCSSCPPADALMHRLSEREDVIGLALHVDYWDYLGWKDDFASPSNTERQKGYAHSGGRTMVYTPQMVVMGQEDVVGAHAMDLMELIERHRAAPRSVSVEARRAGRIVTISLSLPPGSDGQGQLDVHLVRYTPRRQAHITRGELAGRDLDYANVVDGWTVIGRWDANRPFEMQAEIDGDRPVVVLVQKPDHGPILAATRVE